MPKIGEIKTAKELGRKGHDRMIYKMCPDCGKRYWVYLHLSRKPSYTGLCRQCIGKIIGHIMAPRGEKNANWKGGRTIDIHGYVFIKLQPDDFFYTMADNRGYIREHRLVMARFLGRNLHPWELVHHKNHNRQDNRLANLQLVTDERHNQITILENRINHLEAELAKCKAKS